MNITLLHIRGLKDVKTLILTPNPKYDATDEKNGEAPAKWICPLTKLEFNGNQYVFAP